MTRWLVTGAGGMLGQDLTALLAASGADVTGLARSELDVTDEAAVGAALREVRPDVVANCAAWTAVDEAEFHEDAALAVNGHGTAHLAAACAEAGARLVQMSTDYVFSGAGTLPYAENDLPAPRSAYGRTKLAGERAARKLLPDASYVVRTAWLYGAQGPNFVRTMIRLEACRDTIDVVNDQYGQPTWTCDVARQITRLIQSGARPGIYHVSSSGSTTWMGLAQAVFELLGADPCRILPTSSRELARPAERPAYSVLGHARWTSAGLGPLPDWEYSLRQAFPSIAAAAGREPVGQGSA
jgi:dTDP-4-dehydrorhamnose reductase